ncbi:septation ring formation regulator EzrA [Saliterribacillus persicus]|uniref:Septation ring formation regulator EzrA n=1 Tax=Saliterribacillus persicus TaxID=930114 RepID=A0A368XE88_9BACI|nr:septation ring formation regulator EzrA [Saliterribacillus persicus]RCW66291.1 septation ring formation regulator [Saliterribacillus persicus]
MEFVIGGILVIIALLIVGLIFRKKVYDDVDRLENWKMDIMNRNVTTELSKVKQLNLSGETQEKFEGWKSKWDRILTRELPDIEEYLLDSEESADKFRMKAARNNLRIVEQTLEDIEKNIEEMFVELDQLLDSEKYTRQQVEELQPRVKELKQFLLQNRTQYGVAEIRFEVELDELDKYLMTYYDLANNGDYYDAQQVIDRTREDLDQIEERMNEFPVVYKKCKQLIPEQMKDLIRGMEEMKQDGYHVEQFGFEKEIKQYEEILDNAVAQLEKGNVENIAETLEPLEDRLNEMYLLLEKEAKAKSLVDTNIPNCLSNLEEIEDKMLETKQEIDVLQKTYYLEKTELELYLSLQKWLEKLQKQFEQTRDAHEDGACTHIDTKDKLEEMIADLEKLQEAHDDFKEQINDLRKDELEAKEKVVQLENELNGTIKKLQKSNIPGAPSYILNLVDEASDKHNTVKQKLQKQPLDMGKVQHSLTEAKKSINSLVEQTQLLLDQARLVEVAIQYGNRYRRSHPVLASQLSEAEQLFYQYKYESALEIVVRSLEEVDPHAMKRLEAIDHEYQQMAN